MGVVMGLFWWWPFGKVPEVSANRLDAMRAQAPALPQLLDVRAPNEWRSGHIAGAINVPITEFGSSIAGLKLDPKRPIVAICRSAHRSIPAVRLLRQHGFDDACQLQGGMLAWVKAGLAVEGEGAAPLPPAGGATP
jgi:rhodanese-related sulfurtransferase